MARLNLDRKSLRKFGITMGIAFLAMTVIILARHRHSMMPTAAISVVFFLSALILPSLLKPVYIIWMRFAFCLSWFNTRLILTVLFYLVFMPISLVLKIFAKDLLDRKIEKEKNSYWHKKEKSEFNRLNYERQF